jgi:bacillolysin
MLTFRMGTVLAAFLIAASALAQARPSAVAASRSSSSSELRALDQLVDQMLRSRELRVRDSVRDSMLAERYNERLDQYYRGVRIIGGEVTRQIAADGTASAFGLLHEGLAIDTTPALDLNAARRRIGEAAGGEPYGDAELVVLPLSDGYHLTYTGQAWSGFEIVNVYIDANSGALIGKFSDFHTEVGTGTGTYGDTKKMSVKTIGGTFLADDGLRPAAITTYDMKGSLARTQNVLNRVVNVATSDVASDADNTWTDSTVVDAHVYAGWYYDYLFKRFNRHGLDDRDLRMPVLVHPVRIQDIGTAPSSVIGTYYVNAFYCPTCGPDGRGAITLGEGAPRNFFSAGSPEYKPFSASLDVVAHELTHGVTAKTANLANFPWVEAGALNEAFSDMFGTATEFFYEPVGTGYQKADYLIGEDVFSPFGFVIRVLNDPLGIGRPDHYSNRRVTDDPHINASIPGHAFYLAIEGGRNRTSGLTVQGVGAANREQVEKAFFRALTTMLPSNATFGLTRLATIQAATDLYGAASAATRAITQAWDAVGVQPRTTPTAGLFPNPSFSENVLCGGARPSWSLEITVSAGSSNLTIGSWNFEIFDPSGRSVERELLTASEFAQFFNYCAVGSSRLMAQTDACAAVCVTTPNGAGGFAQASFTGTDASGAPINFSTARVQLVR